MLADFEVAIENYAIHTRATASMVLCTSRRKILAGEV